MNTATKKTWLNFTLALIASLFLIGQTARADEMGDLQKAFASRLAQVRAAKDTGLIGETATGKVEGVKAGIDAATQTIVDAENADRSKLYELIAKKEGTTADIVARTNAVRNFKKAKAGDWLKSEDGKWAQRK